MFNDHNIPTMQDFIDAVRRRPCLWNPMLPEYREPSTKDDEWRNLVLELNKPTITNIQVAKTEWRRLRDNHRDALKRAKLGKNKLLPAKITTWKYAKAMQFLEPYMKYRITENIEMEPNSGSDVSTTNTISVPTCSARERQLKSDKSYSPEISVPTSSATEKLVKIDKTYSPKKRRYVVQQTPILATSSSQETDSLQSFFNCLLQSTREMPPWMQTQVKKKIFAVVIEAEEYLSSQPNQDSVEQSENFEDVTVKEEPEIKCEIFIDDSSDNNY